MSKRKNPWAIGLGIAGAAVTLFGLSMAFGTVPVAGVLVLVLGVLMLVAAFVIAGVSWSVRNRN